MKSTSEEMKLLADNPYGARWISQIELNGVVLDDEIENFTFSEIMNGDGEFTIGNTSSAIVSFDIRNPSVNLADNEVKVYQGINVKGTIENVKIGTFKALKPTIESGITNYQLVDRMTYLMSTKYTSNLSLPTTDIDMINDICSQVGIECANNDLVSHEISLIPTGYTKREVLGYLAQLQGKNAKINADGNLEFVWYKNTDYIVDDDRIYFDGVSDLTSENVFTLNYIECATTHSDTREILVSGSGELGIYIENPFMTQAILEEVFDKIGGFTFMPGEFEFLGDFRLEVGDIVTVNTDNNTYTFPIMQLDHDSDGGVITNIRAISQTVSEDGVDFRSNVERKVERITYQIVDSQKQINENTQTIIEQGTEIKVVQGQIESKVWREDVVQAVSEMSVGAVNLLDGSKDLSNKDFFFAEYNLTDGENQLTYGNYALCI